MVLNPKMIEEFRNSQDYLDAQALGNFIAQFIPNPARENGIHNAEALFQLFDPEIFDPEKLLNRSDLISGDVAYLEYLDILLSICNWVSDSQNRDTLVSKLYFVDNDISRFRSAVKTFEAIKAILMGHALFTSFKVANRNNSAAIRKEYQELVESPMELHKNELIAINIDSALLVAILNYFVSSGDNQLVGIYNALLSVATTMNSKLDSEHQVVLPQSRIMSKVTIEDEPGNPDEEVSDLPVESDVEILERRGTEDERKSLDHDLDFSLFKWIARGRKSEATSFLTRAQGVMKSFKNTISIFHRFPTLENLGNVAASIRDVLQLMVQFNLLNDDQLEAWKTKLLHIRSEIKQEEIGSIAATDSLEYFLKEPFNQLQGIILDINANGQDPIEAYRTYALEHGLDKLDLDDERKDTSEKEKKLEEA